MSNHTYNAAPQIRWPKDSRIAGRLTITDAKTGDVLYEGESREVEDGETLTITWTRSDDG